MRRTRGFALCERRAQYLERNLDTRGFVAGAPDFGLPAGTQLFEQGVAGGRRSSMISSIRVGHGLTGVRGSGFSTATLTGALASAEFGAFAGVAVVVAGLVPGLDCAGGTAVPPLSSR